MSQQTPSNYRLDDQNDLDNSFQFDTQQIKRDSDIVQLNFESEDYHHEPNQSNYQHEPQSIKDSQFSEEGLFSYDNDHRMRESIKSEEDIQLEDVSGNSDMTDRNIQKSMVNNQQLTQMLIFQKEQQNTAKDQSILYSIKPPVEPIKYQTQTQTTNESLKSYQNNQQAQIISAKSENLINSSSKETFFIKTPLKQQNINERISKQTQEWSNQLNRSSPPKLICVENKQEMGTSIREWFKQSDIITSEKKQYNSIVNQQPSPLKIQNLKQNYLSQMEAEINIVQQNFNNLQKTNKSITFQKEKLKNQMNKTHHPPRSSIKNLNPNWQQISTEDYRMLVKISFEKKKENYQMLKEWDRKRAQSMNLHRNMVETLHNEIDKRIKASLENFEIYTNFFKEKLKQEEKFINSPIINTKYALQNNAISKNIYINCSVILNCLSQQNQIKTKKVQDFISLIKQNIIKDLTNQHLQESQRQLLKVREKISSLKNSLKKYNNETEQKSEELAKHFSQSFNNITMKSCHDFFLIELQFLRCASQQILIQKRLGQNCLEYYHTALNQQFKRAKVIRQALITYSKGLKQTYSFELQDVGLQQLSKSQQTGLIKQFYSLDNIFDNGSTQILKQKFTIPDQEDIKIIHVSQYIQNFEFENFNNKMLFLKQFNAKYFSNGSPKDLKSARQQNCHIAITVDFYIHLFFSSDKALHNFKPDVSLKIAPKEFQIRLQKDEFIEIVKKQEKRGSMISYFWDSKNQKAYLIKLASKDSKQEFCDYVRKLML